MWSVVLAQVFTETTHGPSLTFLLAKFDGLLGLGFQEIAIDKVYPVWQVSSLSDP